MSQLQNRKASGGFVEVLLLVVLIAILVGLGAVVANRQALDDWWRLRGYQPPAAVAKLANQDTMNSYTRHLFYLNRPGLLSTVTSFRQDCPENKATIVLGCYHADQDGIFIYNVQDPTLAGVTQVTAAHEVLHAVYARLTTSQRNTLDSELEAFYKHGLSDPRVLAEVKLYQQTEPTDVMDEMSCTFGTEVANLPAGLESYYRQYFTNRAAIVGYEQQYQGEFTTRQNTITADDQQLATQKQAISNEEAALSSQLNDIDANKSRMDSQLASSQTAAYNSEVSSYNASVDSYNEGVNQLQSDITSYNQLVATRNQLATDLDTLDKALDTRLTTQTTR